MCQHGPTSMVNSPREFICDNNVSHNLSFSYNWWATNHILGFLVGMGANLRSSIGKRKEKEPRKPIIERSSFESLSRKIGIALRF